MKKIDSLKIKQMQINNLKLLVKTYNLNFLEDNIEYLGKESCDFLEMSFNQIFRENLYPLRTQNFDIIKSKIKNIYDLLLEEEYFVGIGSYTNFTKEGNSYNVPSLPIFSLCPSLLKSVLESDLENNSSYIIIFSDNFQLLVDSSSGDIDLENPDKPIYELYFKTS